MQLPAPVWLLPFKDAALEPLFQDYIAQWRRLRATVVFIAYFCASLALGALEAARGFSDGALLAVSLCRAGVVLVSVAALLYLWRPCSSDVQRMTESVVAAALVANFCLVLAPSIIATRVPGVLPAFGGLQPWFTAWFLVCTNLTLLSGLRLPLLICVVAAEIIACSLTPLWAASTPVAPFMFIILFVATVCGFVIAYRNEEAVRGEFSSLLECQSDSTLQTKLIESMLPPLVRDIILPQHATVQPLVAGGGAPGTARPPTWRERLEAVGVTPSVAPDQSRGPRRILMGRRPPSAGSARVVPTPGALVSFRRPPPSPSVRGIALASAPRLSNPEALVLTSRRVSVELRPGGCDVSSELPPRRTSVQLVSVPSISAMVASAHGAATSPSGHLLRHSRFLSPRMLASAASPRPPNVTAAQTASVRGLDGDAKTTHRRESAGSQDEPSAAAPSDPPPPLVAPVSQQQQRSPHRGGFFMSVSWRDRQAAAEPSLTSRPTLLASAAAEPSPVPSAPSRPAGPAISKGGVLDLPIAHLVDDACALFVILSNFDQLTASAAPLALVQLLNDLFSTIDAVVASRGAYKLLAIGGMYFCLSASGVSSSDGPGDSDRSLALRASQHSWRMAQTAVDIVAALERGATSGELSVAGLVPVIQVGLCAGPVAVGIIGTRSLNFHAFGDTVNTASRMASNGRPWAIQLHPTVADLLRESKSPDGADLDTLGLTLTPREPTLFKGKGLISTFWLTQTASSGRTGGSSRSEFPRSPLRVPSVPVLVFPGPPLSPRDVSLQHRSVPRLDSMHSLGGKSHASGRSLSSPSTAESPAFGSRGGALQAAAQIISAPQRPSIVRVEQRSISFQSAADTEVVDDNPREYDNWKRVLIPRWFSDWQLEDAFVSRRSTTGGSGGGQTHFVVLVLSALLIAAVLAFYASQDRETLPSLSPSGVMLVAVLVFAIGVSGTVNALRVWCVEAVMDAAPRPGVVSNVALALEIAAMVCFQVLVATLDAVVLRQTGSTSFEDLACQLANVNFLFFATFAVRGYRCWPLIANHAISVAVFACLLLAASPTAAVAPPLLIAALGAVLGVIAKLVLESSQRNLFVVSADAETQRERCALLLANMLPSEEHGAMCTFRTLVVPCSHSAPVFVLSQCFAYSLARPSLMNYMILRF